MPTMVSLAIIGAVGMQLIPPPRMSVLLAAMTSAVIVAVQLELHSMPPP